MNFKHNSETVKSEKNLFNNTDVFPISLDYILPDYYPDITTILKTHSIPKITSWHIKDGVIHYEICVNIVVIYKSSDSNILQSVSQIKTFSKDITLDEKTDNPICRFRIHNDSVYCKAKNERRFEVQADISVHTNCTLASDFQLLCDCFGGGIQLKKQKISTITNQTQFTKEFSVSENCTVSDENLSAVSVLFSESESKITEIKNISGKLAVKGIIKAFVVYTFSESEDNNISSLQTEIPFSQIIDIKGFTENDCCDINSDISAFTCKAVNDSKGNLKSFDWQFDLRIDCVMSSFAEISCISDAYSTKHSIQLGYSHVFSIMPTKEIKNSFQHKASITSSDINKIYFAYADIKNIHKQIMPDKKQIILSGLIVFKIIAKTTDNSIVHLEKESSFEMNIPYENLTKHTLCEPDVRIKYIEYNIISSNNISLLADIETDCKISERALVNAVNDISSDDENEDNKPFSSALRIYFGKMGESVWDIAKKYRTNVSVIAKENNLENDYLSEDLLLLIPMIH
jgi:hypothetical protein